MEVHAVDMGQTKHFDYTDEKKTVVRHPGAA